MNKRTLHRPLALLLALAMTLTLTSVPVLAAGGSGADSTDGASDLPKSTVSSVRVGGERLTAGKSNKAGTATFSSNKVLTLNGYTGGGISASDGDLTIEVTGTNRIYEPNSWGIQVWYGKLTIEGTGSKAASLTIHSQNSALNVYRDNLTVSNLKEFNCSSTTTVNPIIYGYGASMTFENIGTMLVRGNTSYSAIYEAAGKNGGIIFESIDALEILNDGSRGITAQYGLTIDKYCGTVLVLSKKSEAIHVYGQGATIAAQRLIAVGNIGIDSYLNHNPVDLTGVTTMLIAGQTKAIDGSVTLPSDVTWNENDQKITRASSGLSQATIQVNENTTTKEYDGQPIQVMASAVDKDNQPINGEMTYIYSWYEKNGTTPLMETPTDVGEYKVKVYGFSNSYYSAFSVNDEAKTSVTITRGTAPDSPYEKARSGDIGKGNNVFDLPAIPDKMNYDAANVTVAERTSDTTGSGTSNDVAANKITASISGGKLLVTGGTSLTTGTYIVTIPVKPVEGANYNQYNIVYTLNADIAKYIFDRCDGSNVETVEQNTDGSMLSLPDTTLYSDDNTDGAWQSDIDTAKEFDYTFDGWYTAPNGWGTKATTYTAGTTYFAHWVATRAVVGYIEEPEDTLVRTTETEDQDELGLAYVQFKDDERKTVYTTGLDFTQAAALREHIAGNGYTWTGASEGTGGTLELSGVLINSGTSSSALTLPADTTIVLKEDVALTGENITYVDKDGIALADGVEVIRSAKGYNNVYGGKDEIPSLDAKGELTISTEDKADCALSMRGGEASVLGNLKMEKGSALSAPGIYVAGDVALSDNSLIATVNPNQLKSRQMNLVAEGRLYGTGILAIDGDIRAAEIDLDDSMLMAWGAIQGESVTFRGLKSISSCDSLGGTESITLDNSSLIVDGEAALNSMSVYTVNLTVENGSTLEVSSYDRYGIYANQMTVRNSTVNVEGGQNGALMLPNTEGKNGNLTLERARVTGPNGVRIETDELGQRAMVGDVLSDTLLIQPYNHSSSSSSSNYAVNIAETKNGTVTPSATRVGSGSTVTLTVEPDGGYVLDSITAKDAAGKDVSLTKTADGKYTFKMPSSAVTVNASFRLRFTDVDPNAWYFDGVQDSVKKGLMEGMSETIFAPNGTLTRAQLVTILWRMEQQPSVNYALPFTDVVEGQWYTEAVRWAASTNVVNGTSATTFTPDAPVTREQLVTMLWRYAKQKGYDVSIGEETNILSYADATTVSEYAIPAMQWACGAGIIQGADGKLLPKDSTTRAQIATIFQRFGALKA